MVIRSSSSSGIPFGGTSGRPANAANGQPYFNGDIGRLELFTSGTGWQNIVQETPGVASITGVYNQSAGSGTFTISGTNFVSGAIAYAIGTNGVEYESTSTTYNSLVQLSTTFTNLSVAYEPYDVKVVNPSNLFGLLPDAFYINDSPIWGTSAGSLGSYLSNQAINVQLAATDDESSPITYSVTSGSLPSGVTLSSSGLISGAISGGTTQVFNFTVTASDGINPVARSFSIAYTAVSSVTGGTLTSDSTYYYRTFTGSGTLSVQSLALTADILIVGGGGPGGGNLAGGGGAGGYKAYSAYSLPVASQTITIGAGGARVQGDQNGGRGSNGINTSFGSIFTCIGGGAGGSGEPGSQFNGLNGGSGGGSTGYTASPTRATGTVGQGNDGGVSGRGGPNYPGAGGGGSNGQGEDVSSNNSRAGDGGAGTLNTILGPSYYWAAGGGGGIYVSGSTRAGNGGIGGGGGGGSNGTVSGLGGTSAYNNGVNGIATNSGGATGGNTGGDAGANTGSGGGGAAHSTSTGGAGGSGIVVVRYTKTQVDG